MSVGSTASEPSFEQRKQLRASLGVEDQVSDDILKSEEWVLELCTKSVKTNIMQVAVANGIGTYGRKDEIMNRTVDKL